MSFVTQSRGYATKALIVELIASSWQKACHLDLKTSSASFVGIKEDMASGQKSSFEMIIGCVQCIAAYEKLRAAVWELQSPFVQFTKPNWTAVHANAVESVECLSIYEIDWAENNLSTLGTCILNCGLLELLIVGIDKVCFLMGDCSSFVSFCYHPKWFFLRVNTFLWHFFLIW